MAEHQLPKLTVRVRFPSPAPAKSPCSTGYLGIRHFHQSPFLPVCCGFSHVLAHVCPGRSGAAGSAGRGRQFRPMGSQGRSRQEPEQWYSIWGLWGRTRGRCPGLRDGRRGLRVRGRGPGDGCGLAAIDGLSVARLSLGRRVRPGPWPAGWIHLWKGLGTLCWVAGRRCDEKVDVVPGGVGSTAYVHFALAGTVPMAVAAQRSAPSSAGATVMVAAVGWRHRCKADSSTNSSCSMGASLPADAVRGPDARTHRARQARVGLGRDVPGATCAPPHRRAIWSHAQGGSRAGPGQWGWTVRRTKRSFMYWACVQPSSISPRRPQIRDRALELFAAHGVGPRRSAPVARAAPGWSAPLRVKQGCVGNGRRARGPVFEEMLAESAPSRRSWPRSGGRGFAG